MPEPTVLGEVAQVVDCEHKTAPVAEPGTEFGYSIGTPNLKAGRVEFSSAKRVDRKTFDEWSRRAVLGRDDLILAREAPVGQVAYIDGTQPVCLGQRTVLIRADSGRVDSRYLHYRLLGPAAQSWMSERSAGSTVPHLNVADVRQVPLPDLPSIDEQRRIAGVLGALDDLIDTNRRIVDAVAQQSRVAFARCSRTARHAVALGSVAVVNEQKTSAGPGTIRYLDITSLGDGSVIESPELIDWSVAPTRARRLAKMGDTLWSTVRPNRRAHVLLLNVPHNLVVSTGIAVLTPTAIGPAYLYAATDDQAFVDQLVSRADGSAYPAVRADAFETATIPLPSADQLQSFEVAMWPLWLAVAELQGEAQTASRARDELLPLLLTGRIRVRDGAA